MANLGIALQFPTPPLDLTHREALPGNPYGPGGNHLLDRVRGPINCDAYGIYWKTHFVSPGIGKTLTNVVAYDRPLLRLLEVKEDILSVVQDGPTLFTNLDEGILMFDEFPILRVAAWVYPNCTFDFFWVVVF